jgi:hypothetical protein
VKQYFTGALVVATAFLALVFVVLSHQQVWHTDVWGHLRFGEYIVREHRLPEHEMFSGDYADQEHPYLNFQWIAQAGNYLVYEFGARLAGGGADRQLAGGALALATEHAVLVTLRLFVLLLAFRRLTGSLGTAVAGIVLVVLLSLDHLFVHRPQAFGELFFALLLLAPSRPVLSRAALVFIPLVLVLWANCHGSFPMGFVLLGAFVAGRGIDVILTYRARSVSLEPGASRSEPGASATGKTRPVADAPGSERNAPGSVRQGLWRDAALRRLALALVFSLVAVTVLNPHGLRLFQYTVEMSRHPNIQFMNEWQPTPPKTTSGYIFLASLVLLVPLLRWSPLRFTPTQVILLLGFGEQSLAHVRVLVWWSVVIVWVTLPHWQAVLASGRRRLAIRWPAPVMAMLAGLAIVVGFLLSAPGLWACTGYGLKPEKRVTDKTPYKVADYLREQYSRDPSLKRRVIFTSETVGDYLLWNLRLDPPVRVFCYSHVHLLTPEHWQECLKVKFGDAGWEEILDRHGVQFLVVENMALYDPLMEEVRAAKDRWEVVFDSPLFVARRKKGTQ